MTLTKACLHSPVAAQTSCSDGNACNGAEHCDGQGTCVAGSPPPLDDGDECTQDACDPISGVSHTVLFDHSCTDSCGVVTHCRTDGACGQEPFDDSNPCTADYCDPALGVAHSRLPTGTACDDGNPCNGISTCDAFGTCKSVDPLPDGVSCTDGNPCNGAEICVGGACTSASPLPVGTPCDDGDPCTELDSCDGLKACVGAPSPNGTSCDDGEPCTGGDACSAGRCFGAPLSGTACGDGDACNGVETCMSGQCVAGVAPVVDDGDPETIDACDPASGVVSHVTCAAPDLTVATTLADMVECLHSGPNPLQTGITEPIDPLRVAAIHGEVKDAAGEPLAGVSVALRKRIPVGPNNPTDVPQLVASEFGSTVTRADGSFDLALNGGGSTLILEYSRPGYLSSQREIIPEKGRFVNAPQVVLLPQDPAVSTVEVGPGAADIQVARGSLVNDGRGVRQVTLFFQPGTVATMKMPDGTDSVLPAGQVHVRATEYTTGPEGPKAMPGTLPPSSAYTYAVDLNLEEAIAAGARSVAFDPPVVAYLENFIGLPTGENMPSGAYRPDVGLWEVQTNGRVIRVVDISNGVANLDIDDSPDVETDAELAALGVGLEERERIAELYAPGQTLWRIPVAHFSPWDWNMGFAAAEGSEYPNVLPDVDNPKEDECTQTGSIIGCDARSLGEVVGVVGTPFSLHYQSDRMPGYVVPIRVPATGETIPDKLMSVTVELDIAGQHQAVELPPSTNLNLSFVWDGKNGLGQVVQGPQTAQISVGYEFPRAYAGTAAFGGTGGSGCRGCIAAGGGSGGGGAVRSNFPSVPSRPAMVLWQRHRIPLHHLNALYEGFGGLTLDVHHLYDPSGAVLYRGDGTRRSGDTLVTLSTYAGGGNSQANNIPANTAALVTPRRIAQAPDGSLYIAESTGAAAKIVKVDTNQVLTNVWVGPGGSVVNGIAAGADGTIYFSLSQQHQVLRLSPGASIAIPFAGDGIQGKPQAGAVATSTRLDTPMGLAVGPDGSVYIAEVGNHDIQRVDVQGVISRVVGSGFCKSFMTSEECGDGGLATWARLNQPQDISVGADGTLYIADTGSNRVRAVTPDGIIHRVAGLAQGTNNNNQQANDILSGVSAKTVKLNYPVAAAIAPDGALYITEQGNGVVRRIEPPLITLSDETSDANGKIRTVAGTGPAQQFSGEGSLATAADLPSPLGVLPASDGSLLFADVTAARIFRVRPAMPGLSLAKTSVVSEDGSEIYIFDEDRRHEKTVDSMTGRVLYAFEYDADHLLTKITDAEGHETHVIRQPANHTIDIVGPFGHTTTIHLGADGYADSVSGPDSSMVQLTYTAPGNGLLSSLTDPLGNVTTFSYALHGRLVSDTDPLGGAKTLATLLDDATHRTVSFKTPLGRETTYHSDFSDPSAEVRSVTGPDGSTVTTTKTKISNPAGSSGPVGQVTTTLSDGTTVKLEDGPDPRLGLQAPFAQKITTSTGGVTQTVTRARTVTHAPNDITNVTQLTDQTTVNVNATWTSTYQKQANGGATWTRTSPMGRQGTLTHDSGGRVTSIASPAFAPLVMSYVASGPNKGRISAVSQTSAGGTRTTTFTYDNQGNLVEVVSPLNHSMLFGHDANGRVTQSTTPDGRTFTFQYDLNGSVTAVQPPVPGGDHHFTFDARGLVTNYTPADLGQGDESTSYNYSADGQPWLITLPGGKAIGPSWDSAGRLFAVQTASGSTVWSYFADGPSKGKVSSVVSPDNIQQALTYQGALVSDVTWTGEVTGSVQYAYDSQFRASSETIDGTAVYRDWNLDGQLVSTGVLQLSYDPTSGVPLGTSAGVVQDGVTWNDLGELTSYSVSTSAPLLTRTYQRDAIGRITQVTESINGGTDVAQTYTYDLGGRLIDVSQDGAPVAHYDYDAHGNRTSTTYAGQTPIPATFDAQDRIVTYGDNTYTHAITGERLAKATGPATTIYTYDTFSQLQSVTLPNGSVVEYLYDAQGRRVAKKLDQAFAQRFLYGGAAGPVALVSASGVVQERYVYATSGFVPDYVVKTTGNLAGTYRLIKDERGSVRFVVDTVTAAVMQQIEYDAFGRILSDTNPGFTPFGFGGGLWDAETSLVHLGARDYDPETGRWTTQDPIGLGGGDTNLYAYVGGDPINGIDPSGLAIETGNTAMNSALNGGTLAWLGFTQFAQGAYNYNNGVLELSSEATFNQGIKDMRTGACQMVAGGLKAIQAGQTAIAAVAVAGAIVSSGGPVFQAHPGSFHRTHNVRGRSSAKNIQKIADSMRQEGWNGPTVKVFEHNGTKYVLDGHHRLAAARLAGLTDVPYESIPVEQLSRFGYSSVEQVLVVASEAFGL